MRSFSHTEKLYCSDCDSGPHDDTTSVMFEQDGHASCLTADPYVSVRYRVCKSCLVTRASEMANMASNIQGL